MFSKLNKSNDNSTKSMINVIDIPTSHIYILYTITHLGIDIYYYRYLLLLIGLLDYEVISSYNTKMIIQIDLTIPKIVEVLKIPIKLYDFFQYSDQTTITFLLIKPIKLHSFHKNNFRV